MTPTPEERAREASAGSRAVALLQKMLKWDGSFGLPSDRAEAENINSLAALTPAPDDATVERVADDGWIEWRGGICPVDVDQEIEYQLRYFGPGYRPLRGKAGHCRWDHGRSPETAALDHPHRRNDIVAYRLAALPPRPSDDVAKLREAAKKVQPAIHRAAENARAGRNGEVRLRATDWHKVMDLMETIPAALADGENGR